MAVVEGIIRSIQNGLRGFREAYLHDKSIHIEIVIGIPIYVIIGIFLAPLTPTEWALYLFSYFFILIVELLNTAIEKLLDRLHPEKHELIRRAKDIAASAVLLSFVFAIVILLLLALTK